MGSTAVRAETPAGTLVTNTATLHIATGDADATIASNLVSLTVAERLDVSLARRGTGPVAIQADGAAVPFVLTNAGNGEEAFALVATPSDASVRMRGIAIDRDGDGRYDPARDLLLADDRSPPLASGATLSLLVLLDPASPTTATTATTLSLTATAVTGAGAAGTVFAGKGDGGGDAVTGASGAAAPATVPHGLGATAPTLVKSQSVRAPDGSATAMRGAIVTYSLQADFPTAAKGARIVDPIPAGTSYVAGSLTLDGVALTDAADDDAGGVEPGGADGGGVAVTLGDIVAAADRPVTQLVRFQVKIL